MLLAYRLQYRILLCNSCITISQPSCIRWFQTRHGPLSNEATIPESVGPQKQLKKKAGVRKTKKNFAELPKTLLNPDGLPAEPLPPWIGGLEAMSPSKDSEAMLQSISTRVNEMNDYQC